MPTGQASFVHPSSILHPSFVAKKIAGFLTNCHPKSCKFPCPLRCWVHRWRCPCNPRGNMHTLRQPPLSCWDRSAMKFFSPLVSFALQVWATAGIAFKRLLTQRFLALASIAGLMIASGFILSVPLYADATYFRLLREELLVGRELDLLQKPVDYAPLSFVFEQKAAGKNSPQWKNVEGVDQYLTGTALQTIDFPILQLVRRFRTDGYFMYPPRDPNNPGTQYSLTTASFAFITPLEETIIVVNGMTPQPFVSLLSEGDAVEAMASESLANEFGVQVGDSYSLRTERGQIPVMIVGLWRAVDPTASYWDVKDDSMLIVHEESYKGIISDRVADELRSGIWNILAK